MQKSWSIVTSSGPSVGASTLLCGLTPVDGAYQGCPLGQQPCHPCKLLVSFRFSTTNSFRYWYRVQNCCARVVTRAGHFAPSTPLCHSLHWLPTSFRIQFKILTLTYNTLSSGKPSYLAHLIHLATPNRNLRFNKGPLLSAPKCKTKTGTGVFSVCAPSLWYKLPLSICSSASLTCFRQRLKCTSLA